MDADPMGCYLGQHTYLSGVCIYCDRRDPATNAVENATKVLDASPAETLRFD